MTERRPLLLVSPMERGLAAVLAAATFLALPGAPVLTFGSLLVVLLGPLIVSQLWSCKPVLAVGAWLCALSAVSLPVALAFGDFIASREYTTYLLLPLWLGLSTVGLVWAHRFLGLRWIIGLAAIGGLASAMVRPSGQGNLWKYDVGIWITIGLLGATIGAPRARASVLILLVGVSAATQTRNLASFLLLAVLVSAIAERRGRPGGMLRLLTGVAVASLGIVLIFSSAQAGLLGKAIQTITVEQSRGEGIGAALLRARPEARANFSLIARDPLGGSLGARVAGDVESAVRQAFREADRDPDTDYVQEYLLGSNGVELHSVTANLWFYLGALGLLTAATLALGYAAGLMTAATGDALDSLLVIFFALRGGWDLLFSPISDLSWAPIFFAVALITSLGRRPTPVSTVEAM